MPKGVKNLVPHSPLEGPPVPAIFPKWPWKGKTGADPKKIFTGPEVPTPFGKIKLPDIETPPLRLPTAPDERTRKVLGHGLGEDLSGVIALVPWIGDIIADALEDTHHAEIKKILTGEEYSRFAEYNKAMPTTVALARTLLFKKV